MNKYNFSIKNKKMESVNLNSMNIISQGKSSDSLGSHEINFLRKMEFSLKEIELDDELNENIEDNDKFYVSSSNISADSYSVVSD